MVSRSTQVMCSALGAVVAATALAAVPAQSGAATLSALNRRLGDSRITESSGLCRSTYGGSLLYTHNDSGDSARFFAVNAKGRTVATYRLGGATARDWEDISTGPNHTIWLGDIGDNSRSRRYVSVYRVHEPSTVGSRTLPWTRYSFVYPDGHHNAESLMVQPKTGRLYIVTKSRSGAGVYRAPATLSTTAKNRLTRIAGAPVLATGGEFFPDGRRFVIRNHNWAYVYGGFGTKPRAIKLPYLRQGESVALRPDGRALFVGSEGVHSPIYRVTL